MENTTGGYDFEVVGEIVKEYECPICLLLIREAIDLPCTHVLCHTCLTKWEQGPLDRNEQLLCPTCKTVYEQHKVHQNKFADRIITTSLKVKCKKSQDGCQWIGTISDYKDHQNTCLYAQIKCIFPNCEEIMIRSVIETHIRECRWRLVTCNYCHNEEHFINLKKHYGVCMSYPTMCPNVGCNESYQRKDITHHRESECPFQQIQCDFKSIGCEIYFARKDLQDHLNKSMQNHMIMMLHHTTNISKNLITTNNHLDEVKERLMVAEEQLSINSKELNETKNKLKTTESCLVIAETLNQKLQNDLTNVSENSFKASKLLLPKVIKSDKPMEIFDTYIKLLPTDAYMTNMEKIGNNVADIPDESIIEKHSKFLETFDHKSMLRFEIFKTYTERFQIVMQTMEYHKFYTVDNEKYMKVNLKDYIENDFFLYIIDTKTWNSYSKGPNVNFNNNEVMNYKRSARQICLYFLLPYWNNDITDAGVHHPHHEERITKANINNLFSDIIKEEYLLDGDILIHLKKKLP